jgi:L-iditol 2-dehydrogenase
VVRGQREANFKAGQNLLILGAGISGILHLLLAKHSGANKVMINDIDQYRLQKAKELGASKIDGLADLVIVCTSSLAAFNQALESVDKAGTILFFAPTEPGVKLPIPVNDFWRKGIKIIHSYGASPQDLVSAIDLLGQGAIPVKNLITHRVSLKDCAQGFRLVSGGKECLKVIVESS